MCIESGYYATSRIAKSGDQQESFLDGVPDAGHALFAIGGFGFYTQEPHSLVPQEQRNVDHGREIKTSQVRK